MQPAPHASTIPQYSLGKILAIWAAAALPMAILGWVIAPALASGAPTGRQALTTRVTALTLGLVWQFVLAMIIVYREEGDLRWPSIRRRLWLNAPQDPRNGPAASQVVAVVGPATDLERLVGAGPA